MESMLIYELLLDDDRMKEVRNGMRLMERLLLIMMMVE